MQSLQLVGGPGRAGEEALRGPCSQVLWALGLEIQVLLGGWVGRWVAETSCGLEEVFTSQVE